MSVPHSRRLPRVAALIGLLSIALLQSLPVAAHDYPTYERVQFALDCMQRNGGAYDLIYKCSCAIDKVAEQLTIDEFVDLQTALNAGDMSGQRGGELRGNPQIRDSAKRYRQIVQSAGQSCGISAH
jgi:hypothetical protein